LAKVLTANPLIPKALALSSLIKLLVTGIEYDRHFGSYLQHAPGHVTAGHTRHGLIGDNQVEDVRLILKCSQASRLLILVVT
jgi:hypothetical protein